MTGKTTAKYLCPCSDEETGFQGQSFWVELTWASDVRQEGCCVQEMCDVRSHLVTEHLHSSQDHPNGVLCEEARILPILRKNAGEKHWTAAYRFLGPTEVSVS